MGGQSVPFLKKICMTLEDLPDGARVFVDANILIYHFSGISSDCRTFLERCEARQVESLTGTHIVLEVAHRVTKGIDTAAIR
jgi:predicted nucleic acid-binding protein